MPGTSGWVGHFQTLLFFWQGLFCKRESWEQPSLGSAILNSTFFTRWDIIWHLLMLLMLLVRLLGERWAFLEEVAMDQLGSGDPWIFDGVHRSQEIGLGNLSYFTPRRNMCKAEGAEHYITAADRHWRTDGELRAVAEVYQISYTFLCTSELPMLREGVKNPSHGIFLLRG